MIEDRTLIREVLVGMPDGNCTRQTQRIEVQIRWPGGEEPDSGGEPYTTMGEWRLLPKEK